MFVRWLACAMLCVIVAWPAAVKKPLEPKITSIYPVAARRGSRVEAEIRGTALMGATSVLVDATGIKGHVLRIEPVPVAVSPNENSKEASKTPKDDKQVVHIDLEISADAPLGWHEFRLVTAAGVTNQSRAMVVDGPVIDQHDTTVPLRQFPIIVNSRIRDSGDYDTFPIDPEPGDVLTIEAISGHDSFDPTVTLFEESGSWFNSHRLNRLAFNDEPLSFPGLSTDARLVWRFEHAGKYRLQVNSFDGKGGPDYVYQLRIARGVTPLAPLHPVSEGKFAWEERQFTRTIADNWLDQLAQRAGSDEKANRPELFHAVPEGYRDIPVITMPALVEGRIAKPGETHVVRLKVEKAEDLAIEVETPKATLPRFNPVVRLMQPDGHEMASDVYTKLNNNGLYMMKMIEPKTALNLQAPGEYTIAIRDITVDCAGDDFAYRVLVRKKVPHVGKVDIAVDHVNLERGDSKPISVRIDREEGFAGYVTLAITGLPPGVTALQAMEKPEDNPPLPNAGKAERYFAKDQATAVILVASAEAAITPMPVNAHMELRVVNKGKLGPVIAVKEIPVMVIERNAI